MQHPHALYIGAATALSGSGVLKSDTDRATNTSNTRSSGALIMRAVSNISDAPTGVFAFFCCPE